MKPLNYIFNKNQHAIILMVSQVVGGFAIQELQALFFLVVNVKDMHSILSAF